MTAPVVRTAPTVTSHRRLPARATVAVRVLQVVDDPDTGSTELAHALAADPALAARVLALANSAYFGLSGRVATLPYAVAVVGFQTIRAIAAAVAGGLGQPDAVPEGFWIQAATTATAAGLLAPVVGASPADAFCVGLLNGIGSALLHQVSPIGALCLPIAHYTAEVADAELRQYGESHCDAAVRALRAWHFPERMCEVIAGHHDAPLPDAAPIERCLQLARVVADGCLPGGGDPAESLHRLRWLSEGRVTEAVLWPLIDQVRERSDALLLGLAASP